MKYKTEWNLGLVYKGDYRKQLEADNTFTKKAYLAFAKKYRKDKKHLKSPVALVKAIEEYEKLGSDNRCHRGIIFFHYRKYLNSADSEAEAQIAKLADFHANLGNEVEFFMLEIGKIPKDLQIKFLKSKEVQPIKYFLKKVFENAKYNLSEAEEKIMNLKSMPAHGMWTSGQDKLLSKQTLEWMDKTIPVSEASEIIQNLKIKERRELHKKLMQVYKNISDFSESEINAIITDKKINDKLRGFKEPYEATVLGYENEPKTVKDLVDVVTSNMHIAHKFFKLKADMLGEKHLTYADRSAKVGEIKIKIPFEKAVEKVVKSFEDAEQGLGKFVEEMFKSGQVDVFPRKGKGGVAFCSSATNMPTFVFLNHIDDFKSMNTLAHEMGHALHAKFSKTQRPMYQDHTISSAEVASTFFENMIFDEALGNVSIKEKLVLLHDKIAGDIATIFRQIACFNFEVELHNRVRKEGFLQKETIADLMNKHMQSYLGNTFKLERDDGFFFVPWSHIRNFFYVYSYAFGQLVSDALYTRYKQDKSKMKDVIKFLSAGGSESPENIFRSIGINPNKKFFEAGLKKIEKDIVELENLWKKSKIKR